MDFDRRRNRTHVQLHYIVQRENYHEVPAFVDFCERYQADIIWFAKVYQGVDMSPEDLKLAAVHRPDHPLHQDFLQVMRHPNVFNPRIDWTNMAQFVDTLTWQTLTILPVS